MGVLKRNRWLAPLGLALAIMALSATRATAFVGDESGTASDRAGSIVIFPKVIADGTRDTLITLTNTKNLPLSVHCVYFNGAGVCSTSGTYCTPQMGGLGAVRETCPVGETCEVSWQDRDFSIDLTVQQPTVWRVSTGRVLNPADGSAGNCEEYIDTGTLLQGCPGIDPGNRIPVAPPQFRGELICYEMDDSGAQLARNALKGEATIETLSSGDISRYNSINLEGGAGIEAEATGQNIALDINNGEYNVCPESIEFTHYQHAAQDIIANRPVRSEITFVPCSQFQGGVPIPNTVHFQVFDEFETPISASFVLDCWANLSLEEINSGTFAGRSGEFLKTRIRAGSGLRCREGSVGTMCASDADCGPGGVCGPPPGVLAILEEIYEGDNRDGYAAVNPHMIGMRSGRCRADLGTVCQSDLECGSGACRANGDPCVNHDDCPQDPNNPVLVNRCDFCLIDEVQLFFPEQ